MYLLIIYGLYVIQSLLQLIHLMFKKPLKIGGQSQLSGKDKKTLKSTLVKQFEQQSIEHLFNNTEKILSQKISGSKMLVYMDEDSPLFVDPTGKSDFFPSLYTVMAYPNIIPSVQIFEAVQENIYKGANLMWPGVQNYSDLGQFQKDGVVGVKNSKGNFVAIGALAISKKDLNQQAKKGVCLQILTHYNDKLWQHGSKMPPKPLLEKPKTKVEQKVEIKNEQKNEQKKELNVVQNKQSKKKAEKGDKQQKGKQKDKAKDEKKDKKGNKKNKKQQSSEEQEIVPQPPKSKVQEKKQQKKNQKKQQPVKAQPKKQQTPPESSESEDDFTSLIHKKKDVQPVVRKVQNKKQHVFSDQEDDHKKKKKAPKKPAHTNPPKQEVKKQKPQENEQSEQEEQDFRKGKKKDNKKKKGNDKKDKQEQEQKKKKDKKKRKQQSQSQQREQEQAVGKIKPELMDEYFKEALLNCLVLSLRDDDLPIDSGQFFTDYVQLGRREGVHLDIKSSSYGKMNKFYQTMSKQGILEFKQGKQKNGATGATISKINRDHEELKDYVPTIKKIGKKQAQEEKGQKQQKDLKFKVSKTLEVEEVYRPKAFVQHIFGVKLEFQQKKDKKQKVEKEEKQQEQKQKKKVVINKSDFFSWEECKEKINAYIEKIVPADEQKKDKKKDKKDKVEKILHINYENDEFLQELFKEQIQEHEEDLRRQERQTLQKEVQQQQIPEQIQDKKKKKQDKRKLLKIDREQFQKQVQRHLEAFHRLIDKPNNILQFKQGKFKGVQVIAEKANNKNITRISGIQLIIVPKNKIDQQITNLTNIFQQKFASSVNVQNLPGKFGGKQITIQGTFLDEVVDFLVQEQGANKDLIIPVNKLDKKKKN